MTAPVWFPDVPPFPGAVAPVEISNNSGGSWAPYNGAAVSHVAGPTGTQRFRRVFTVPPGVTQTSMRVSYQGDIVDIPPNILPQLHLDGGPALAENPVFVYPNVAVATFPMPAAGVHTLEVWVGQAAPIAGNTRLDIFNAQAVDLVPCGCCPINLGCFKNAVGFVWSCRTPDGVVHWYDEGGSMVASSGVVPCVQTAPVPLLVTNLLMNGVAFGDGPDSLGENICAVNPLPTSMVGFVPVAGGCYDPPNAPVSMTWAGPLSSVEMQYANPPRTSGGVIIGFTSPATGVITWPTNLTGMAPGAVRISNPITGGHATFTYISGPAAGGNSPRMEGGANIGLHRATTDSTTPPTRYRLDLYV